MLKRAVFSLFEGLTLSKSGRPYVRQTAPYAYTRSGHLRRTGFPSVQKGSRIRGTSGQNVKGHPSQDSHISISVHYRTEITHSRKGYFDFLTKMEYYPEFKDRLLLVSEKSIKFAIFKKKHSTHEKTKQHYLLPAHGLSYGLHPQ